MGVDGLGLGGRPEEPGHLGVAFLVGLIGEGKVLAVGLRLSGKGFLEVLLRLGHRGRTPPACAQACLALEAGWDGTEWL